MLNLSLNELKLVAKSKGIKGYKTMSKEILLSALSELELVEKENNFDDKRLKKIRKDFNEFSAKFSKPQIKEIIKNLYEIKKTQKNLSAQKIKEMEENLFELEKSLSNSKKCRPQNDFEHKNLKDVGNLFNEIAFNQSNDDEDYNKPIKTKKCL